VSDRVLNWITPERLSLLNRRGWVEQRRWREHGRMIVQLSKAWL
jgi:hypothetical protein